MCSFSTAIQYVGPAFASEKLYTLGDNGSVACVYVCVSVGWMGVEGWGKLLQPPGCGGITQSDQPWNTIQAI